MKKKKRVPRNPIALALALRHPFVKKMRDRRVRRQKDRGRTIMDDY